MILAVPHCLIALAGRVWRRYCTELYSHVLRVLVCTAWDKGHGGPASRSTPLLVLSTSPYNTGSIGFECSNTTIVPGTVVLTTLCMSMYGTMIREFKSGGVYIVGVIPTKNAMFLASSIILMSLIKS